MNQDKQRYHHGDLRNALLDAALRQIRDHGVEKLSLRAVAREAGVSQTAPYRHFADKEHLLAALAVAGFRQLRAEALAAAQRHPSAADGLVAVGLAYIAFARGNPERYKLMFGPTIGDRQQHPELQAEGMAAFQVVIDQASVGIARGEFVDQPPFLLASGCWAEVHGIASLLIDGFYECAPIPSLDDFFRALLELQLRGVSKKT